MSRTCFDSCSDHWDQFSDSLNLTALPIRLGPESSAIQPMRSPTKYAWRSGLLWYLPDRIGRRRWCSKSWDTVLTRRRLPRRIAKNVATCSQHNALVIACCPEPVRLSFRPRKRNLRGTLVKPLNISRTQLTDLYRESPRNLKLLK